MESFLLNVGCAVDYQISYLDIEKSLVGAIVLVWYVVKLGNSGVKTSLRM